MLYHLVTRTEYGFIFKKHIYYLVNQFNWFNGAWKEVSAVKHKLMKDSLKKYLTKTYLYHLITGTEDGFIFDKVISSIVTPFNFFSWVLKEVSAVKHNHIQDSLMKYFTQTCFYHHIPGTEDGFNYDKCIHSIVNHFYFLKGV